VPLILVAMVAWTALYYFCFDPVGYLISTAVFLLGLLSYFHRGHILANIAIAAGFTLAVDILFSRFLSVPMPPGLLSI
jgi:putative tricarboxylic transport membrane protein